MALLVGDSKIAGKGVFADTLIKKGTKIFTLTGENISMAKLYYRVHFQRTEGSDDPLMISRFRYIDLDAFSRTFNHSCSPNCGIQGESDLVAVRDIQPGDEITYDYSTACSPDIIWWRMPCSCGASTCRKVVRPPDQLPSEVSQQYLELGVLPPVARLKRASVNIPLIAFVILRTLGLTAHNSRVYE